MATVGALGGLPLIGGGGRGLWWGVRGQDAGPARVIQHDQSIRTITDLATGESVVVPLSDALNLKIVKRGRKPLPPVERFTGGTKITVGKGGKVEARAVKQPRRTVARRRRDPFSEFVKDGKR